jgi:hypothetical protein
MVRALQLWCAAYIAAGGLVIIGAFSQLERAPAVVVAYAAFCWIWVWAWLLTQSQTWVELPRDGQTGSE